MTITNPAVKLVTSYATDDLEAVWVHPDLTRFVNLAPCESDDRLLQSFFVLPIQMTNGEIADAVGGLDTLTTRKASFGQFEREVQLAREGQKGLFKKGSGYILYLEGNDGSLMTVYVDWFDAGLSWYISCCRFVQDNKWREGNEVCGN